MEKNNGRFCSSAKQTGGVVVKRRREGNAALAMAGANNPTTTAHQSGASLCRHSPGSAHRRALATAPSPPHPRTVPRAHGHLPVGASDLPCSPLGGQSAAGAGVSPRGHSLGPARPHHAAAPRTTACYLAPHSQLSHPTLTLRIKSLRFPPFVNERKARIERRGRRTFYLYWYGSGASKGPMSIPVRCEERGKEGEISSKNKANGKRTGAKIAGGG
jgi:hypothetical protein